MKRTSMGMHHGITHSVRSTPLTTISTATLWQTIDGHYAIAHQESIDWH